MPRSESQAHHHRVSLKHATEGVSSTPQSESQAHNHRVSLKHATEGVSSTAQSESRLALTADGRQGPFAQQLKRRQTSEHTAGEKAYCIAIKLPEGRPISHTRSRARLYLDSETASERCVTGTAREREPGFWISQFYQRRQPRERRIGESCDLVVPQTSTKVSTLGRKSSSPEL
jgi:hypothetical protein